MIKPCLIIGTKFFERSKKKTFTLKDIGLLSRKEMNKISHLIESRDWYAIYQYNPKFFAKMVSLTKGMVIAYHMLLNDERDDDLRDYAVQMLLELRLINYNEWALDWKNDFFLGDACHLTMQDDESYNAYKRASEKADPLPPSLLLSLAGCYLAFDPRITVDEAESLVKRALEQEMSIEGVVLLRGIYAGKNDQAMCTRSQSN
jgi:hypothetical protein